MEQQNNPWMNFHLNASEYADRRVFGLDESPITPGQHRHDLWLIMYDQRMTQLQRQFTEYQLNRTYGTNRGTRH